MGTNIHEFSINSFLALVRAGLWEQAGSNLDLDDKEDWGTIYQLAQEQSVLGLVLAGLEHSDRRPSHSLLLQWIGEVQIVEQQNKAMNVFVAQQISKLREAGVNVLLMKGQGIAQCYERPTWRTCGDVDLLLDNDNYEKANCLLDEMAESHRDELGGEKHIEYTVDSWVVELHGNMPSRLFERTDKVLEEIQNDTFGNNNVRLWKNGNINVAIPAPDNDVMFVFTHILKHFFRNGIGLRQVCDWCRLLYRYRSEMDLRLLDLRLKRMGLMSEWKAFASLAVNYLGMPAEAMPLYSSDKKWERKAERIFSFIIETGNFGHNRDSSYYSKYPLIVQKFISLWRHNCDILKYSLIFPLDSIKVWNRMFKEGIVEMINRMCNAVFVPKHHRIIINKE